MAKMRSWPATASFVVCVLVDKQVAIDCHPAIGLAREQGGKQDTHPIGGPFQVRSQQESATPEGRAFPEASRVAVAQSCGSTLTIEAPWLLPTQKVTGVVELSTHTRRTLVNLGN
jgi:hypothetical protein